MWDACVYFCIQKLGQKYCLFVTFFALRKLGVAHGRIKKYCIHSCHYVQLKSPSSCNVKNILLEIDAFLKLGFFRPVLSKNCACLTSTFNGQLGVRWPFGVVSFKVLQLRCSVFIWYGYPKSRGFRYAGHNFAILGWSDRQMVNPTRFWMFNVRWKFRWWELFFWG